MTTDIAADCYFGYDPTVMEPGPFESLPAAAIDLPDAFELDANTLPPVGDQGAAGDCFVWASAYGALTYKIAQTTGVSARDPSNQPAVGYTYNNYLFHEITKNEKYCPGSQVARFLNFLQKQQGTPSESTTPTKTATNCGDLWTAYDTYNKNGNLTKDPRFQASYLQMSFKNSEGELQATEKQILDSIKTLIFKNNYPIIYGTRLYNDWKKYKGKPHVYVGNGEIWRDKFDNPIGHVMIIIGYDNTLPGKNGAFLIQNSSGSGWGATWKNQGGYVWMDCHTFLKLAEGTLTILPASS